MPLVKAFSRRSFIFLFVLGLFVLATVASGFYFGFQWFSKEMVALAAPEISSAELVAKLTRFVHTHLINLAATIAGLFVFCGVVIWIGLRGMVQLLYSRFSVSATPRKKKNSKADSAAEDKAQKVSQQRLFLHLLAVLQRQGRLVDFLSEDLEMYEDDQIGAAVRGIHESCKKVVDKALALEPVIKADEGQEVTVDLGFDPSAIKLTGNVTGDPPFTGILRHKGWRTPKIELPVLSDAQDASIIAPAEVEIP
jgi:hypothetical protein